MGSTSAYLVGRLILSIKSCNRARSTVGAVVATGWVFSGQGFDRFAKAGSIESFDRSFLEKFEVKNTWKLSYYSSSLFLRFDQSPNELGHSLVCAAL